MNKINYNVLFNTHTVSGIIISVGLYIIFFAGSFSFFREEIDVWQRGNKAVHLPVNKINCNSIIQELGNTYNLLGRDINILFKKDQSNVIVSLGGTKDTIANPKAKGGQYFYLNTNNCTTKSYAEQYGLSNFLYRLHFLDPIVYPIGRYSAGLIALFFVFAIVTGIIVHWKKMVSNFYVFKPKAILKKLWTDAHTGLGLIGLPFQFMYGVTGTFFIIGMLALIPIKTLYGGDSQKLMEERFPGRKTYEWDCKSDKIPESANYFIGKSHKLWGDYNLSKITVSNFGGTNMRYIIHGELGTKERFVGKGRLVFDAYSNEILYHKDPYILNYIEDNRVFWKRLHFGDFGGSTLKIIYFIFGILTCFVIITGVLIWIESRNKKSMTLKQRLYTARVGYIYLGICLSMFPVFALLFIFSRLTNGMFDNPEQMLSLFYFVVWFLFVLFYAIKKDNYFTNKHSLLIGAIFGFLVPIVNGFTSGNWFWKMYAIGQYEIFTIDVFWIIISFIALVFFFKVKPSIKEQSSFNKYPLDSDLLNKAQKEVYKKEELKEKKEIPMKTKIVILWIFLGIGWVVHHMYGLFGVYYTESLMMENANGQTPVIHHIYRIVFEGLCFLFALLSIEISKKWFVWLSLVWGGLSLLYNFYHLVEASINEASNLSELFMLVLMVVASFFLVRNLNIYRKTFA